MRIPIIAGNWKMHKTRDEAIAFIEAIEHRIPQRDVVETMIFCSAVYARCAAHHQGANLRVGVQNMHFLDSGAYTGEISAPQLLDSNIYHVIIGHSERRHIFGETDEMINLKVEHALKSGMTPILCVGETLEERQAGETETVLTRHVTKGLADIPAELLEKLVIAYEPVWAIGTGRTATSAEAQTACAFVRAQLKKLYGEAVARATRILYGGSVKPGNIAEIIARPDIDGALIGGASLDPDSFVAMAQAAVK